MSMFKKKNGTWHPVTPFVKVGGVWKPAIETFKKVNGKWMNTTDPKMLRANFDDFTIQSGVAGKYLDDGTHRLELHSGRVLELSGDGKVELTTGHQVTYYNATTKKFVSKPIPYTFANETMGQFAILDSTSFTQADLDKMDADNTLLFQWAKGTYSGFSIGAKKPEDKYYAVTEDGAFLLEVDYSEGAELINNGQFSNIPGTGTYVVHKNNYPNIDFEITAIGTNASRPTIQYKALNNEKPITGKTYLVEWEIEVLSGSMFFNRYGFGASNEGKKYNHVLGVGIHKYSEVHTVASTTPDIFVPILYFDETKPESIGRVRINSVSSKEITSNYLPIQGTYKRLKNQQYGLQTLQFELNDVGVPTALEPAGTLNVANGYLEMKWKPDTPSYTIEVTDAGKVKKLTHNPDKLTVDGTAVTPTPALPPATQFLQIGKDTMGGLSKLTKPIKIEFFKAV